MKFDGTNNFGMWRCDVTYALTVSNLEYSLQFKKKQEEISRKD